MVINEIDIDVNIESELDPYIEQLQRVKYSNNKIQCCSPFREENKPSFAINLETGQFIDSGNFDEEWRKGNFVKLLSFFRDETYDETANYLLDKYTTILNDVDSLQLSFDVEKIKPSTKIYPLEALKPFCYTSNYLDNRNITPKVKKAFRIGFDPSKGCIVFPIFDKKGNIVNLKYRSTRSKVFWYEEDGQPIKQHLYGLNFVLRMDCKTVYIVEGEVDCLYLWSLGIPAVATFGASLSDKQLELLLSSPIETIVVASDNDKVGETFGNRIEFALMGLKQVKRLDLPKHYKDVNEVLPEDSWILKNTIDKSIQFVV